MTTDEIASIRAVIAQERRTIRRLTWQLILGWRAPRAQKVRWRALKKIHTRYIAKWQEELKG